MREDFEQKVKDLLGRRVGYLCSNPNCKKSTVGPQKNPKKTINIGVAAHINAASKGGKRYDPKQTPDERKSFDNGIWLCQSCSKLIDSDEERYTVNLLKSWKRKAESAAQKGLEERDPTSAQIEKSDTSTIVIGCAEEDIDFVLWLSSQLISQGYPVWCKLLNSEPGEYSEIKIEEILTNKASKYLFILSGHSNGNSNLQKELRFAYKIMQSRNLEGFVVPIQVNEVPDSEMNILLQGTSPIDFSQGWSIGLDNLLKYLNNCGVKKDERSTPSLANNHWSLQIDANKALKNEPEELLSNWFSIHLPEKLYLHELQRSGIGRLEIQKEDCPFPVSLINNYLITFTIAEDFSKLKCKGISIVSTIEIKLQDFLDGNYEFKIVKKDQTWKIVIELLNDAWDRFISSKKLVKYLMSNNHLIYYFPINFSSNCDNKAYFTGIDGKRKWRSLAGKHKIYFWHFGIQGRAMLHPAPIYIVKTHALASSNGTDVWESTDKLHTARRRWFKNWWNPEWRDRLIAAINYLSGENEFFEINLGTNASLTISSSPLVFLSPVSYTNSHDALIDIEVDDENLSDDGEIDNEFGDASEEDEL